MFETLKNILRTGDSTVKYPFEPIETPPGMRGKPEHDSVQCIACTACAVACPPNAIQMQTDLKEGTVSWNINYGRCIFCGRCEESCPVEAIALSSEFELAVMTKEDLEETSIYSLQACESCGKLFAPKKAVDYVASLLEVTTESDEGDRALETVRVCPECKRVRDGYTALESATKRGC